MAQQPQYVPIYFAPDIDPSWTVNPGVLIDVVDAVPTLRNTLKSYAAPSGAAVSAIGTFAEGTYGYPLSGCVVKGVNGVADLVIGTSARLLSNTGSAWSDVSQGAADYASGTVADWTFTTFGNSLIACNVASKPQVATIQSGACSTFADLGGTPAKAALCTTNKNFVLLGAVNDGTAFHDRIDWSGLGNDATWTPDAATQAGNYRLVDTPGPIRALVNLRDTVIAYKDDSIYVGEYQGSPLLWTWRLVSDRVGCSSSHGVAVVNGIHYFLHPTGVYRFDGSAVQPIGTAVARYVFNKLGARSKYQAVQAVHDEFEKTIYWYFGSVYGDGTGVRSSALVWNYMTGQFGFVANTWATTGTRIVVPATAGDLTAFLSATFDTVTSNVLVFGTSNVNGGNVSLRQPLYGSAATGATLEVTTGDVGDDYNQLLITRVKPRYLTASSASAMTSYGKDYEGGSFDSGTAFTADTTKQRFDGLKTARWHKLVIDSTAAEIGGLTITSQPAGTE